MHCKRKAIKQKNILPRVNNITEERECLTLNTSAERIASSIVTQVAIITTKKLLMPTLTDSSTPKKLS